VEDQWGILNFVVRRQKDITSYPLVQMLRAAQIGGSQPTKKGGGTLAHTPLVDPFLAFNSAFPKNSKKTDRWHFSGSPVIGKPYIVSIRDLRLDR
jgi:hypothetical protein